MSNVAKNSPPASEHDDRRREFLELCGRLGVAVPPTVMLLASGRNALASHGASQDGDAQGEDNDEQ